MSTVRALALSPDGTQLALVARDSSGRNLLWVRPLNSSVARPLPATENPSLPFWSPDGRSIGFFADGKLKRIDTSGGPAQTICDAPVGRGGTWNRDGVIVFTPVSDSPLYRVDAAGGKPTAVTKFNAKRGESSHRWPVFLPDGRRFLYLVASFGVPREGTGICVGSLDADGGEVSGEGRRERRLLGARIPGLLPRRESAGAAARREDRAGPGGTLRPRRGHPVLPAAAGRAVLGLVQRRSRLATSIGHEHLAADMARPVRKAARNPRPAGQPGQPAHLSRREEGGPRHRRSADREPGRLDLRIQRRPAHAPDDRSLDRLPTRLVARRPAARLHVASAKSSGPLSDERPTAPPRRSWFSSPRGPSTSPTGRRTAAFFSFARATRRATSSCGRCRSGATESRSPSGALRTA